MLSDNDWPKGLTEDGDKLFLKDNLFIPENRAEDLLDHWHNTQFMHPGRDKLQKELESDSLFPPAFYAVLNQHCKVCAFFTPTKHPHRSTAGTPMYTAIVASPMGLLSIDVFAMAEVIVEGEVFDRVISAVDRHSGYIVAVRGEKSKKKDKRDKQGVGLQAKTMAQTMIGHWLAVFDVPAVTCSDRGTRSVGAWFSPSASTWHRHP